MKKKQNTPKSKEKKQAKRKVGKFLYWTPRILSIVFILFLMLFSLDVFDLKLGFWGTVIGLFMHNIPSLILLVVLVISWKHEIVGGIAFILAGLAYIAMLLFSILRTSPYEWYQLSLSLPIAGPSLLIGILFLVGWKRKKETIK